MTGSADTLLGVVEGLATATLAAHPKPAVLLVFSCAARMAICGARVEEEARRLQAAAALYRLLASIVVASSHALSECSALITATLTALAL